MCAVCNAVPESIEAIEPYLSTDQVAEKLGMQRLWVYQQARDGKIPFRYVGRLMKFKWSEVERAIDEQNEKRNQPLTREEEAAETAARG